jgi:hypothetical protein
MAGVFAIPSAAGTADAQSDPIFDSSVFLLRSSMTVDRRGQFSILLRSLRQLEDPDLKPFYQELLLSENRTMRIHGILGLAEIDPKRQLDLTLFAEVTDAMTQSEILGAALDGELLSVANAKQIMTWAKLDPDAKIVVATHLLEKKEFNDLALLKEAAKLREPTAAELEQIAKGQMPNGFKPSNPAKAAEEYREYHKSRQWLRRAVVGLLLMQLGDPAGEALLDNLNKSADATRDDVQGLVLQTAFRFKFDRVAPWAARLSTQPGVSEKLGLLALRTAMRFGHKESMRVWTQQYNSAADVADRMRLAVSLLNLAQYVEPGMFDPLTESTDPITKQIGLAGKAVSSKAGIAEAVTALIKMDHPVSNAWALGYANFHATPEDARVIFTGLINAYEQGPARNKAQRLDEAMVAAQAFFEKDAAAASQVLRPILNKETTDKSLVQGIFIALIRATKGEPHKVAQGLTRVYEEANSNGLKLLLLAKHGVPLTPQQLKDLGLLVRGGGALPDALRLQAAWAYLKQTKQAAAAMEKARKG